MSAGVRTFALDALDLVLLLLAVVGWWFAGAFYFFMLWLAERCG
jgi:hypothetical protein